MANTLGLTSNPHRFADSDLTMSDRGYRNLNASVLRQISKALEHDPAADIKAVLEKVYASYGKLRLKVGARLAKQQPDHCVEKKNSSPQEKPRSAWPRALQPFESALRSQSPASEPRPGSPQIMPPVSLSCNLPRSITYPLSPIVRDLLEATNGCSSDLSSMVIGRVLSGVLVWANFSRAVIQVGENVIVKVAQHLDPDEHDILRYLEERFPSVAAPRALGMLTVGSTSFMFMTLIPGVTLETRWSSLSAEQKTYIRSALDNTLLTLRELELPNGEPFGSPVGRRICKDVRRDERVSTSPIYSEAQFNDSLLRSPSSRVAPSHKNWLRSMMRVDHRIVFTHGDFHPRNVMVVDGPDGRVALSGIIDWEASGFYPEYWEQLKALNTRSIKDTSDWWDHLPPSILGYDHEVVLDRVIVSTVTY